MVVSRTSFFSYCYIILVTIMYGFSLTELDIQGSIHDIILILALLCAFAAIMFDKYYTKSIVKTIGIILLGFLVYFSSHETLLIIMLIMAIMVKNIGYNKALKLVFNIRLVMFLIVVFCILIGYLDVGKVIVSKGIYGSVIGYGVGYSHPNNFAEEIFYLSTLYLCIKNEKIKSSNLFILLIIDCITYWITGAKTACILFLILICVLFIYKKINNERLYKVYSKFCIAVSLILPIISIVFPIMLVFSSGKLRNILSLLNGKLNQRLSNATMLFYSFPITLFGKIIDLNYLKKQYGYNVVDNGYVFLFFNFGVIGFILVVFLYYFAIKKLIKKRQVVYFSVIVITLCLATMENILRAPFVNFCMFFWWEVLSETFSKVDNKLLQYTKRGEKND